MILSAVVGLHVLALISFAHTQAEHLPAVQARTLYASVIAEAAPQPPAAPEQPAVTAPAPPPTALPTPRAVQVNKPTTKPHVTQQTRHAITPPAPQTVASNPAPAAAAITAAPVVPAPPPQPKTITHGVEYLHAPVPEYPESAREDGNEGTVILRVLVDESGKPARVEVMRSSGFGSLDEAGKAAAQAALFKPYREDGHAVSVYVIVPLKFQLDS